MRDGAFAEIADGLEANLHNVDDSPVQISRPALSPTAFEIDNEVY